MLYVSVSLLVTAILGAPDLYTVTPQGSIERLRVGERDGALQLNALDIVTEQRPPLARVSRVVGGLDFIEGRCAVADEIIWVLNVCKARNSGLLGGLYVAQLYRCDRSELRSWPFAAKKRPSQLNARLADPLVASFAGPILDQVGTGDGARRLLPASREQPAWALTPYTDVMFQLARRDAPSTAFRPPFCTIAAFADDFILVGIYMHQRIAWFGLGLETLSLNARKQPANPLGCRSLGVTDTDIDTWATTCWIDDALHLVSDDGKYERFVIKDDKVIRAGQLKDLGVPAAICQGKSHLWVLTEENEGDVAAQEITWNQQGEPAKTKRALGRVTLDEAAVQVLSEEAK